MDDETEFDDFDLVDAEEEVEDDAEEPEYYRLVRPIPDDGETDTAERHRIVLGEMYLLTGLDDEWAVFLASDRDKAWFSRATFDACFKFVPDGAEVRKQEFAQTFENIRLLGKQQAALLDDARVMPHLALPAPDAPSSEEAAPQSNLPAVVSGTKAADAALMLRKTRTTAARLKNEIGAQERKLSLILAEQRQALAALSSELSRKIKLASQAIYMLDCYFGKNEEIVLVRDGERAPADEPIAVRQMILYMDEEAAAFEKWAKQGGIDFQNVDKFDEWIADPEHLQQVLPEKKGIVAIKPRFNEKEYSDNPIVNESMNAANKCIYILIRNGDVVYRIYSDLQLGKLLFPTQHEFDDMFINRYSEEPYRPGSAEYMKAMEQANDTHRRYFTVLLVIQGLIDRTKVFAPLPDGLDRLNVCDIAHATTYLRYIQDAENLLGDGRPKFRDWQREKNHDIHVGCRIILGECTNSYHWKEWQDRVSPKNTSTPETLEIYTIETQQKSRRYELEEFGIRYGRGDIWTEHNGLQPSKRRATFWLHRTDDFFLNFDGITIEDLRYYIGSRIHRRDYLTMLPLLQNALEMKEKEEQEEAPFRLLLVGEIVKKHQVSLQKAELRIKELVAWWKLKNRVHRSLTSEDMKAVRMIVTEFGVRERLDSEKEALQAEHDRFLDLVLEDKTLVAFHRKGSEYVTFDAENQEPVFIRERHWRLSSEGVTCHYDKSWKTVDGRFRSWSEIHAHARWAKWNLAATASDHLTGPEIEEALQFGLTLLNGEPLKDGRRYNHEYILYSGNDEYRGGLRPKKAWMKPLAFTKSKKACYLWYVRRHAVLPKSYSEGWPSEPKISSIKITFEKNRNGVKFYLDANDYSESAQSLFKSKGVLDYKGSHDRKGVAIRFWEETIDEVIAEEQRFQRYTRRRRKKLGAYSDTDELLHAAVREAWWIEAEKKFKEHHHDPSGEYWEEERHRLKPSDDLRHHASHVIGGDDIGKLLDLGLEPEGMTIAEVYEATKHEVDKAWAKYWDAIKDVKVVRKGKKATKNLPARIE